MSVFGYDEINDMLFNYVESIVSSYFANPMTPFVIVLRYSSRTGKLSVNFESRDWRKDDEPLAMLKAKSTATPEIYEAEVTIALLERPDNARALEMGLDKKLTELIAYAAMVAIGSETAYELFCKFMDVASDLYPPHSDPGVNARIEVTGGDFSEYEISADYFA